MLRLLRLLLLEGGTSRGGKSNSNRASAACSLFVVDEEGLPHFLFAHAYLVVAPLLHKLTVVDDAAPLDLDPAVAQYFVYFVMVHEPPAVVCVGLPNLVDFQVLLVGRINILEQLQKFLFLLLVKRVLLKNFSDRLYKLQFRLNKQIQ